ncbi:MAG: TIGR00725 family protein [Pseudomonadota bacterium]
MVRAMYVGIIGAGACSDSVYEVARNVGHQIGQKGWVLVCGGLGGVMEGAARGCSEAGGMTVGILPGFERDHANPYIKISLPTGLGEGRNLLVVRASDSLVSIAGGYGTLSEIGLALKMKKPVVGLMTWEGIVGIQYVSDPNEAIQKISELASFHQK